MNNVVSRAPRGMYWVYLVTENPTRNAAPVKVGITNDIKRRVEGMRSGNPRGVNLFCGFLCLSRQQAIDTERAVLDAFPRLVGEWLDADPFEVKLAIDKLVYRTAP